MTAADLWTIKPLSRSNWPDLEQLFESKGGPQYCWCMAWRPLLPGTDRSSRADKKASLKSYVDQQMPVGLLAYAGTEPVAWCSVAPRNTYRELAGEPSLPGVWSLVCMFIKKEYRHQGLSEKLIRAAQDYARSQGGQYLEAYPVDPDSPSYRFMGFKPTFDRLGFTFRHHAGARRHVMTFKL